jgi:two-component system, cell cycle sensor histidine kinase and response regulator CckA
MQCKIKDESIGAKIQTQKRLAKRQANRRKKGMVDPVESAKKTILVVEDEPTLRSLVSKVLERSGYAVIESSSGVAALELWSKSKPHIDLLLTDMVMPDGISGLQLAETLKGQNPGLKVIFTTGYSAELMGKDFQIKEGVNFLQKPYPPQKLVQTVRNGLASE